MKWFLNLSTRAKLFLSLGIMNLLLAGVIVTAYTGITRIQESQRKLYEEEFKNTLDLKDVRSNQNGIRADLLAMMLLSGMEVH